MYQQADKKTPYEFQPQNQLTIVSFTAGWELLQEMHAILGSYSKAETALRLCVDYCSHNLGQYQAQLERIALLPSLNPDNIHGISEIIMRLGLEVYFAAFNNALFEVGTVRELPYQFYKVTPSRLMLQRIH